MIEALPFGAVLLASFGEVSQSPRKNAVNGQASFPDISLAGPRPKRRSAS
jgi:hypothetical protein